MSTLLNGLAILLGAAGLICAAGAWRALHRALDAGAAFWFVVLGWFFVPATRHMPENARPHARKAFLRWLTALGLLSLAMLARIEAIALILRPAP